MNKVILNDEQFLQAIISAIRLLSIAMPDHMLGIKNLNSVNVYCSNSFIQALGIKDTDIIGKQFLPSPILDIVIAEDQQVFTLRKLHTFLKINKFHGMIKPLIFIKTPLINPDTKNIVGLLFQVFEYSIANSFQQQIGNLYNMFVIREKKANTIKLSKREKQVVFFFLAHLSSQEIAEMLYKLENKRISKSTIDSVFTEQLYIKFNVVNRVALYKKLLELGYDKFIPEEVLVNNSIPMEAIKVY
jgi:hypothetical protein